MKLLHVITDAYPPPQYQQQPHPVQQYQDPNAGLQYYPPQDANFAAPNQMANYPTQPPPYDFEEEKGAYPLAQTQTVQVSKKVKLLYNTHICICII